MDKLTADQIADAIGNRLDGEYLDSIDASVIAARDGDDGGALHLTIQPGDGGPARQFTTTATEGAEPPQVHSETWAVAWPDDTKRGPWADAPAGMQKIELTGEVDPARAERRAREIAARYVHEGARLVRLVTTVHPVEETA